jgi:cysteinyl-tRNA synthetase
VIARLSVAGRPLPIVGRLRAYVCGVTPYDVTHLGHAATFVWIDTVARLLRYLGTEVELTRNVTDVDDVLLAAARRQGAPYDRFAAVHQFRFDQDMAALGVRRPEHEPRAHTFVEHVVAVAAALVDGEHAYVRNGSVYFRGARVHEQAAIPRAEALRLAAEYGDVPDDPAKDDPLDVAVWRVSDPDAGEPAWPSPWGPGRPGWHAECTAMALAAYGPALDLHAGGAELRFPHHAYEAAQAEAVTGVRPFARAWLHVGTVRIEGAKMAKSVGNLVLVSDLLARHSPGAVRLLLLDRPWAAAWDYHAADLECCEQRLDELFTAAGRGGRSAAAGGDDAAEQEVLAALLDDLDVPRALRVASEAGGAAARTLVQVLGLA